MKIKELIFRDLKAKNNDQQEIKIVFGEVNIIVGPKGGGKSSIFELLAGASEQMVSLDILKYFREELLLEPFKIVFQNNETSLFSSLKNYKIKRSEALHPLDKYSHIIRQEDNAKKTLDSFEMIDKERKKIAISVSEMLYSDEQFMNKNFGAMFKFVKQLRYFYEFQNKVNINWTTFFMINKTHLQKRGQDPFMSLVFSPFKFLAEVKRHQEGLEDIKRRHIEVVNQMKVFHERMAQTSQMPGLGLMFSQTFRDQVQTWVQEDQVQVNKRLVIIDREIQGLKRRTRAIEIFERLWKRTIDEQKKQNFAKQGMMLFVENSHNFFISIAKELKLIKRYFHATINQAITFNPNINLKSEHDSSLKFISGNTTISKHAIDEQVSTDKLLGRLIYTPNVKADFREWVKVFLEKGEKENAEKHFRGELERIILETIQVFADDKEYSKMSPGEKSIFGIKYKLKTSHQDTLFLDQPEDNLDNYSISNDVLKAINNKKMEDTQLFIVTHNANIGVLVKPDMVLVANIDLNRDNRSYYTEKSYEELQENPKAYYLEGGMQALEKRYSILKGETNGKY